MKGRKRQIVVDTLGLVLDVKVHRADIQDRKAAKKVFIFPEGKIPHSESCLWGSRVQWGGGGVGKGEGDKA